MVSGDRPEGSMCFTPSMLPRVLRKLEIHSNFFSNLSPKIQPGPPFYVSGTREVVFGGSNLMEIPLPVAQR